MLKKTIFSKHLALTEYIHGDKKKRLCYNEIAFNVAAWILGNMVKH